MALVEPTFAASSEQHPDVVYAKVDTEAQPELGAAFNVMSIPTLMIFRDGILLYSQPGAIPAVHTMWATSLAVADA